MIEHDEEMMQRLLQTFYVEAEEYIQTLNQLLLELERQPEETRQVVLLEEAFRTAHSLKGAARAVIKLDIEKLAHRLEDVLRLAHDHKKELDPPTCDVLYKTLDGIHELLSDEPYDVDVLLAELATLLPESATSHGRPHANKHSDINTSQDEVTRSASTQNGSSRAIQDNNETIRVTVSKLDSLMAQVGELIAARSSAEHRADEMHRLRRRLVDFPQMWQDVKACLARFDVEDDNMRDLRDTLQVYHESVEELLDNIVDADTLLNRDALRLGMVTDQLQDEVRRVRMIPFQSLEPLLQRTVRDLARSAGKQVSLLVKGADVELDKKVLELLKDPLLHLVRNAVGHGIENSADREEAGKPREGIIAIEVHQRGSEAHIVVNDDGQGFQVEAIQKAAAARSIEREIRSDSDIIGLAFMSGVTTTAQVNALSGRGVGLDVVRERIETLQGRIRVENNPGEGVTISLAVPVSLAMTRVLLVKASNRHFALPLASIEKIVSPEAAFHVEGQSMLTVDGKPLVFAALTSILGQEAGESVEPMAVILSAAEQRIALLVEDIWTEQELVVKAFSKPLVNIRHLSGAAVLGNGEPIVVLNTAEIVKTAQGLHEAPKSDSESDVELGEGVVITNHILVVDDSITTRTLEKNILQAAGYIVETATDGIEALDQLKANPIDLVIADVEMPNMDGITLTRHLRDEDETKHLPIILVTSLESQEDRERGMMAGADAYIVKRGFQQSELLATIQRFLV